MKVCVAVCPLKLIMEHHTSGMSYGSVALTPSQLMQNPPVFHQEHLGEIDSHSWSFQWTSLADARGCLGNTQRCLLQETFISQTRSQARLVSSPSSPLPLPPRSALNLLLLYEKLHSSSLLAGVGGVARRHWGIAKMAAVSEGMKTVTLCYQSFQSVPCPRGALLCARRCSHTGAAYAPHWPQHVQVCAPVSCEYAKQMHGGNLIWGEYLR